MKLIKIVAEISPAGPAFEKTDYEIRLTVYTEKDKISELHIIKENHFETLFDEVLNHMTMRLRREVKKL